MQKLGISLGSRVVPGFHQVSDKGLGRGRTLQLNAVHVQRKESGPPCRVTCLATSKGGLHKTGENSSSFIEIALPLPPLKCQSSAWLGAGAQEAPESGS